MYIQYKIEGHVQTLLSIGGLDNHLRIKILDPGFHVEYLQKS